MAIRAGCPMALANRASSRSSAAASCGSAGIGSAGAAARRSGSSGKASRSREEIELVFDRNKGAIFALYNRALRRDPSLEGKLVLRLTIAPNGTVTMCEIVSSELGDEELERETAQATQRLIDRFGTRTALERELARSGMTFEDLEARNRELVRNRLYTMRMVQRHVRPRVEVRDDEVRAFYEETPFPSYDEFDSVASLIEKARRG